MWLFFGILFVIYFIYLHIQLNTMKYKYLYILLLFIVTSLGANAQTVKNNVVAEPNKSENTLEKVQIYPNPVTGGKIYIATETNTTKVIEMYDMLGKRIFITEMTGFQKELSVNNLKTGVYILKITEKNNSITRKVIIK